MVAETLRKLYKDQIFYALRLEKESRKQRETDPIRKTCLQDYADYLVNTGEINKTEAAEFVIWLCEKDRTHECLHYAEELGRNHPIKKPIWTTLSKLKELDSTSIYEITTSITFLTISIVSVAVAAAAIMKLLTK